jgi:hypothetical protein
MKTKTILLFCLFAGMGITQLSAQWWPLPPNGNTGTISWYEGWDGYSIPVYIDGVLVDELTGAVNIHNVLLIKDGLPFRGTQHMVGEIQSSNPPYEVFKVSDMSHYVYSEDTYPFQVILLGNNGTVYKLNFTYTMSTGELIPVKTMVVGKGK